MKTFLYTITAPTGIHVRVAGALLREVRRFESTVTIHMGTASIDARRPMDLSALNVRQGDPVTVTVEGPDEAEAARAVEQFFRDNL